VSIFAIQYLEDGPEVATITPNAARERLRAAFQRLPVSLVLLGWNVPEATIDACAEACQSSGVQLYRWHPILAGDRSFFPKPEWQTIGLDGDPVPGFHGMLEFTFVCPNRPAVREGALDHVRDVLADRRYQGIFLDRMRFPSPAHDPQDMLSCFCEHCQRAAAQSGLELEHVRHSIKAMLATPNGLRDFIYAMLSSESTADKTVSAFLDFRYQTISTFIHEVAALAHRMGKAVGLDCFSPSLARMVGQNIGALDGCAEWTKLMSYGHTLGPSGLPFELGGLADWLVVKRGVKESEALSWLCEATGLPLPDSRAFLQARGVGPEALTIELQRGREAGIRTLLAGIELVEIQGVAELNEGQITADLKAFRAAGADGLVLSWDLWDIPLERLDMVVQVWS
jgi:hypothetical protein